MNVHERACDVTVTYEDRDGTAPFDGLYKTELIQSTRSGLVPSVCGSLNNEIHRNGKRNSWNVAWSESGSSSAGLRPRANRDKRNLSASSS